MPGQYFFICFCLHLSINKVYGFVLSKTALKIAAAARHITTATAESLFVGQNLRLTWLPKNNLLYRYSVGGALSFFISVCVLSVSKQSWHHHLQSAARILVYDEPAVCMSSGCFQSSCRKTKCSEFICSNTSIHSKHFKTKGGVFENEVHDPDSFPLSSSCWTLSVNNRLMVF